MSETGLKAVNRDGPTGPPNNTRGTTAVWRKHKPSSDTVFSHQKRHAIIITCTCFWMVIGFLYE